MRFSFLMLFLCGCPTEGKPATHDTGADDTATTSDSDSGGDTAPPLTYDVSTGELTTALGWAAGLPPFAGYAGTGAPGGFYLADPVADGTVAYVYRIPWGASGALIEDTSDLLITLGYYDPDKLGFEGGFLSIPAANADVGDIASAGIGYSLTEPDTSGTIADLAAIGVEGGFENGYTGRTLHLDADGDGEADDLMVTASTYESEEVHGEIAVYLDVEDLLYSWSDASFAFPACTDAGSSRISYGPVDLALDADGEHLWVACPASNYRSGIVEMYNLPLKARSSPVGGALNVGGWTIAPDPRGGVWAGSQGGGAVIYVTTGLDALSAYPFATESDAGVLFGADPEVIETSTGQILLAVGAQTRSTDTLTVTPPRGGFDPGTFDAPPPDDSGDTVSAVYLCDVTALPVAGSMGFADLDTCARYEPSEAVPCIGAVQALVEVDGVLWLASSGWLYGSGNGCGMQAWRLSPSPR